MKTKKITRLEVIDEKGRAYSRWNAHLTFSVQDDGYTLKIFVDDKKEPNADSEPHR